MWRAFSTSFILGKDFETVLIAVGKIQREKTGEVKLAV
jgi:hypothetical protein